MRNKIPVLLFVLSMLIMLPVSSAGQSTQQYQPSVGQEGKDVIWVPTPEALITAMLDMAKVTPADYVMDLGSGDGRIVVAAAKRGARALGVEYNPDMVALSTQNAQKEGVADRARFIQGDIFETDFSRATVLTMYLLPSLNMRLRPQILEMKPGTRVVTHAFTMEDWEPDQTTSAEERNAYLWIVPAKVAGIWNWKDSSGASVLTLRQTFQKVEGSLRRGGQTFPLKDAKLEGDRIRFAIGDGPSLIEEYSGLVNGNVITGAAKTGGKTGLKWAAQRRP